METMRDETMDSPASPGAPAAPEPITANDLELVRAGLKVHSWPVPGMLAEIDRLRRIEEAARTLVETFDVKPRPQLGPYDREAVDALREVLASKPLRVTR